MLYIYIYVYIYIYIYILAKLLKQKNNEPWKETLPFLLGRNINHIGPELLII